MNKIYRVYENRSKESVAIGYLLSEDDNAYTFSVQHGTKTNEKKFDKTSHKVKSIYEQNGEERYQIKTKNSRGEAIMIDLSKPCYGGCG